MIPAYQDSSRSKMVLSLEMSQYLIQCNNAAPECVSGMSRVRFFFFHYFGLFNSVIPFSVFRVL